ncbi:hypothetical protein C8F04DRAFT_367675 [Mycena alexandri]|uniref:Uncharacterized protein n=1 Tax=Mycena alexandri TaxID=1745969 RepID=A0AAD6T2G2_9AGAR|nr:hypothetical protein C8F04DRAFT_367675 [Mycena alexandri]
MSLCVRQCLKRFPSVSFPRHYATAAVARAEKLAASDTDFSGEVKTRVRRQKKEPLRRPNIQAHLDGLAEGNGQVDLADIERYRPKSPPTESAYTGVKPYQDEYIKLKEKLIVSFNVKQLREFLKLYGAPVPATMRKADCAVAIMEGPWNWPSLTKLLEKERDASDSASETFPLNPPEAFLLLGKDGIALRSLGIQFRLSMTYVQNPQSLMVEGKVGSLKQFKKHVAKLKAAIVEDIFELPENKPIGSHLFQRISRLSGAYLTSFGESKVRVSFNKNQSRTALIAKRLVASAVCEENNSKQTRLFFHLPPSPPGSSVAFPHDYALYPFLSPRSLSWTVSASGVFRMRRVEDWLSNGVSEDSRQTGGLLKGRGRIMSLQLKETDLRQSLLADISPPASNSSRAVIASLGHVLLTSPQTPRASIAQPAPLQGQWKLPHAADWMEKRSELTLFAPTLPTSLLDSQPMQHQVLHRLIYRSINAGIDAPKIIKVELVLPRTVEESLATDPSLGRPRCWVGQRYDLDVLMPDRPADIRFSVFDSINLAAGEWPVVLEEYLSTLRAFLSYQDPDASQPEAPLSFQYEDVNYVLQSNSSVRQNIERTDTADSSSVQVVTESSLDLEGNHKSASCEIICDDIKSQESWDTFLQHCDWMSTVTAPSTRPVSDLT